MLDCAPAAVVPLIADEIASRTGAWEPAALRRALRELLELGPGPQEYARIDEPAEGILYANAFDVAMIGLQLRYVDELRERKPVYPYLWKYGGDGERLGQKMTALEEQGFEGFFLWCWDRDLAPEALRASAASFRVGR